MGLGNSYNLPARSYRRNPSNNTLLVLVAIGGGYYAWRQGWLNGLLGGGPGAGDKDENRCALAVSQHRADLCQLIPAWSNQAYNCSTPDNTIALVQHWWATMNPPEKAQYGTLCAYARAKGWA